MIARFKKVFRSKFLVYSLIVFFLFTVTCNLSPVYADEIEDLQKQIDELNKQRELSVKATKPLEGQLDSLKRQLAQIQANLDTLSTKTLIISELIFLIISLFSLMVFK